MSREDGLKIKMLIGEDAKNVDVEGGYDLDQFVCIYANLLLFRNKRYLTLVYFLETRGI